MSVQPDVQIFQLPAVYRDTTTLRETVSDEAVLGAAQKFGGDLDKVSIEYFPTADKVTVCMSGSKQDVLAARSRMSAQFTQKESCVLRFGADLILDESLNIKPAVEGFLNKLADVNVTVKLPTSAGWHPKIRMIDGVGEVEVELSGPFSDLWQARLDCLVYFDKLSGKYVEDVSVNSNQLPLIMGRYKSQIQNVISIAGVAIYTPSPYQSTPMSQIWISGQNEQQVMQAVNILQDLLFIRNYVQNKLMFSQEKCILLRQFHQNELYTIMTDYATNIEIGNDSVTFTAQMNGQVYAAMKQVIGLCSKLFTVKLLCARDVRASVSDIKTTTFANICKRTGAMLSNYGDVMEVTGAAQQIKDTLAAFKEVNEIQKVFREIHVFSQMSLEYFDFITGKKNGKIIKIEKMSQAVIDIDNEDANFLTLTIHSTDFKRIIQGYALYLEELPAEYEFCVPDSYHKRIIGAGGKNIQVVMKLYGVYVKFRGYDDYSTVGGQFAQDKNVLARTPAKNKSGLQKLYMSVMEMYISTYRNHVEQFVTVPRSSHHLLVSQQTSQKSKLEQKFNVQLTIPDSTYGLDDIIVKGLPENINQVVDEILKLVPAKLAVDSDVSLSSIKGVKISVDGQCQQIQCTLAEATSVHKHIRTLLQNPEVKEVREGYQVYKPISIVKPLLQVQTTPLRQSSPATEKVLLRSAIENSALARSVTIARPATSAGLKQSLSQNTLSQHDRGDLKLKISSGQLNASFNGKAPMTARTPSEAFRRPPGLKIETSTQIFGGPASAPIAEHTADSKFMQSVVRNVMVVSTSNKLNNLFDMLELSKYKQTMADHEVDFEMFLKLHEEDFKELGIPMGPRKKLVSVIAEIKLRRQVESKTPGVRQQAFSFNMTPPQSPMRSMDQIYRANNQPGPLNPSVQLGFVDFMPGTPIESPSRQNFVFPPSFPQSPVRDSPSVSPNKSMDGKLNAIGSHLSLNGSSQDFSSRSRQHQK